MAIVNITRIQHRRGDLADLPQLSSGELGWAIDTQQLFIGNGSLSEGAPYVGNTEILTEHSDLTGYIGSVAALGSFTFEGNPAGAVTTAVARSISDKLNDTVSVRDFGAEGDGADYSSELNTALDSLFGTSGGSQTRIALYIPAGVYEISSPLLVPPNTYVFGDGMGNTIIRNTAAGPILVALDSTGASGGSMGLTLGPNDTLPTNIFMRDITFEQTVSDDLTELQSTTDMVLERVEFVGAYTDITDDVTNSGQVGLSFISPGSPTASGNITVTGCRFRQLGRAFQQTELLNGISFDRCYFDTCWIAVNLDITSPDVMDPVTVTNSYFKDVRREAMYASNTTKFTSIGNRFVNVGNAGTGLATYPVLTSEGEGSVSWMDRFERLATDLTPSNEPRFYKASSNAAQTVAYADPEDRMRVGLRETLRTYKYTVAGGTTENLYEIRVKPTAGYNGNTRFQEVRYMLKIGATYTRTGILQLAINNTNVDLNETYNYVGSALTDAGITFSAAMVSGEVTIDCDNTNVSSATLVVSATNLLDE